MELWQLLFDILLLLVGALVLGGLFERFKQSAVVGFMIAGMVVGPHALDIIKSTEEVRLLAELGVSLLLFSIGLEFSESRLRSLRKSSALGASQVLATTILGFLLAWALGIGIREAIALGMIISLSSTACVLRVLSDRSMLDSGPGHNSLAVLLVQDAAVIPLAFAMELLALGGDGPGSSGLPFFAVVGVVAFGILLWLLLRHLAPRMLSSPVLHGNRELALLLAVVAGLGAASGAHAAGISPALGAFVAGIVLASSPFAVQVRSDVGALRTLLLTLFFGSVGMLANPAWMLAHAWELAGLLAALILLKTTAVAILVRALSGTWTYAIATGLSVAQIGEFSFLLAELSEGPVLSSTVFPYVTSVILLSLLVTPYLVVLAQPFERWLLRKAHVPEPKIEHAARASALVVGFGPAGQEACAQLREAGHRVRVMDLNSASVLRARELGYLGSIGDASVPEVLQHAETEHLDVAVISLPDPPTALRVVESLTKLRPGMPVVVRSRYHRYKNTFADHAEVILVDEEHEVGCHLGRLAVSESATPGLAGA